MVHRIVALLVLHSRLDRLDELCVSDDLSREYVLTLRAQESLGGNLSAIRFSRATVRDSKAIHAGASQDYGSFLNLEFSVSAASPRPPAAFPAVPQ